MWSKACVREKLGLSVGGLDTGSLYLGGLIGREIQ